MGKNKKDKEENEKLIKKTGKKECYSGRGKGRGRGRRKSRKKS